jgi:hypothetical protein
MSKHTPGPWEAKNNGTHWNNKEIDNWIITYGNDDEQIVDHVYEEANARLIAAAPELLAACEEFERWHEVVSSDSYHSEWTQALAQKMRAAIAKARRETP